MSFTYVDATTLNLTARGGEASAHPSGASLIEVVSEAIYVAAVEASAVNKLSVRHPATKEMLEVTTGYTVTPNDTAITPNGTTIRFDDGELNALATLLKSQQPVVTHTDSGSTTHQIASGGTLDSKSRDGNTGTFALLYNTTGQTATFTTIGSMVSQELQIYLGYIPHLHTVEVYKGGSVTPANKIFTFTAGTYNSWFYITPPGYTGDTFTFHTHAIFADPVTIGEVQRDGFTAGGSAVRTTPSESLADSLSLNLELYADVDGPQIDYTTEQVYDCDDTAGWSDENCDHTTDAVDQHEGDRCQVLTIDSSHTTSPHNEARCENDTNWGKAGNTVTGQGGGSTVTEGSNSVYVRGDDSSGVPTAWNIFAGGGTDLTASGDDGILLVAIDILKGINYAEASGNLRIGLGLNSSHYDIWDFPIANIAQSFQTIIIDYLVTPDGIVGSGLTATNLNLFWIHHPGESSDDVIYIDNIRTFRAFAQIQKNDFSTLDFTPEDIDLFPTWFKLNEPDAPDKVRIYHSSDNGSATTRPSDNDYHEWDGATFGAVTAWQELVQDSDGTEGTGSPDVSVTETVQIEMQIGGNSITEQSTADDWKIELKVDDIKRTITGATPWVGSQGDVIEHPVDVARHWISFIGDQTVDETTFGTAETNLGASAKLGGDARGWGTTWLGVLDHIAYLARSNFVSEELAAGTAWKMLCAESDYEWPVTGGTLDQFRPEGFLDAGRDEETLFSGRTFLYGYRPSLGNGEEAFTKLVRIGADQNDADPSPVADAVVDAAVAAFGRVDAPTAFLLGIDDDATALAIAGYYYTEGARLAALFIIEGLSWSQGYALEPGDIRDVVRPWEAGSVKVRVIEHEKDPRTQLVEVRLVEVE
jgi:hypothetical protein